MKTKSNLKLLRQINDAPKPRGQFDLVAIIIAAVGAGYSICRLLNQ